MGLNVQRRVSLSNYPRFDVKRCDSFWSLFSGVYPVDYMNSRDFIKLPFGLMCMTLSLITLHRLSSESGGGLPATFRLEV